MGDRAILVPPCCEVIVGLCDVNHLQKLFRRNKITIYFWRNTKGLPYVEIPGEKRPVIRFNRRKVLAWAKHCGVRVYLVE